MKTKAYKLAAELGLQEQPVLDWLRANGYPNVRRADTIRSEVAQAARKALGRGVRGRPSHSSRPQPQSRKSRQTVRSGRGDMRNDSRGSFRKNEGARKGGQQARGGGGGGGGGDGFKVSFADLLEAHLPTDGGAGRQAVPDTVAQMPAVKSKGRSAAPRPAPETRGQSEMIVRVARAEQERDRARQQADVERARAEGFARELQRLQAEVEAAKRSLGALDALREDNERLGLERATLKGRLAQTADERETLEQTCGELQIELEEVRTTLGEARADLEATRSNLQSAAQDTAEQSTVLGDLETARKREVAWRTRALELERAAAQGGDIIRLLRERGLDGYGEQARVLAALLTDDRSAQTLLRAIRQVDAGAIEKLVDKGVARVCAHPLCNRVAESRKQIPLRVDDDGACTVCNGATEQRWFAHMVAECALAGVRRLLVVGGTDEIRERLRALSQGQPVDLRLVSSEEEASPARATGRVEGCDALIRWSRWVVSDGINAPYVAAALSADRPIVTVLGRTCSVVSMARATVNRLARNHVLRAV